MVPVGTEGGVPVAGRSGISAVVGSLWNCYCFSARGLGARSLLWVYPNSDAARNR